MDITKGLKLIEQLNNDPEEFGRNGKKIWELINEFQNVLPIETLRELFYAENIRIRQIALFITSELARDRSDLLKEVASQLDGDDHYMFCLALQIITSHGESIEDRMRVLSVLEHTDQKKRLYAMHIVSGLRGSRIHEALAYLSTQKNHNASHEKGLLFLLDVFDLRKLEIMRMIDSDDALLRRYGIIAAAKLYKKYPQILDEAVNSQDPDISEISRRWIKSKDKDDLTQNNLNEEITAADN